MNEASANDNRQPKRVLVRGVNWLGDAVMTTPALLRLRQAKPGAHISLLTHENLADLWREHPALDSLLTFSSGESLPAVTAKIRAGKFQVGVAFPNSHRAAIELWLGRVPQRVGYRSSWRSWLLTTRVERSSGFVRMHKRSVSEIQNLIRFSAPPFRHAPPPAAHQIHHYLRLVAALGANPQPVAPRVVVSDAEVETARNKFGLPGDRPLLGLNAGAEYGPAKRWPAERFAEAAVKIRERVSCRWAIFGSSSDVELTSKIAAEVTQRAPCTTRDAPINLAGRTSLRELCALLKLCRVLLTNDTGPMHLAAALGTPVVAIFGSTSPDLTAPGLPGDSQHRLLSSDAACSPCYRRECPIDFRCMRGIAIEPVVGAVLDVLKQPRLTDSRAAL